jgi:quercetin dioxygenase-like cupin family protein
MRNLTIGLLLGVLLGLASSSLVAQRSADSYPDAPTADPKHYSVSFENDVARFLRVRYGPGEKSPMHRHLPGCVVYLTDQTMNFTVPDGSSEKETVEAGALGCGDGNVHAAENLEDPAEFIIIEFKDRKTFRNK